VNLIFPYQFDHRGRTGASVDDTHIRDLIEQVLFTRPGERVMLPEFGSGVAQLVLAPNALELASATRLLIQSALQRWLGELIVVQDVSVEPNGATLFITVTWRAVQDSQWQTQSFPHPMGSAQ
jgi:phage baseplate assembly protein W